MRCQDCFTTGYTWNKLICHCSLGQGITERIVIRIIARLKAGK